MRRGVSQLAGAGAAIALLLLFAGGALAVPPPSTVDQKHECADVHCNTGGSVGVYPVTAQFLGGAEPQDVSLGQTFTAGVTGSLTGVELYLFGFDTTTPPSFTVQIQSTTSGAPSGTVLGSVSAPTSDLHAAPSWVTVTLGTPIAITKDTVYAITLAPLASVANRPWLSWELDSSDTAAYTDYTGGSAFAYAAGGGGWVNGGSAFADGGSVNTDFAFRTLVAAAAATPVASVPTQPPTSTVSPTAASSAGGGLTATLVLLASVGLVAFAVVARPVRRRR